MNKLVISGIQQIGIGIPNVHEAWKWYRSAFNMNIPVFEEKAKASLMLRYTGDEVRERHAILAINLLGGGGMEIWQFTEIEPKKPAFKIQPGDFGIFAAKIKTKDVSQAYQFYKNAGIEIVGDIQTMSNGNTHFYIKDFLGNLFEIVKGNSWFRKSKQLIGGIYGAVIGVSDMEKAKSFYNTILGYDEVVYDESGKFDDFSAMNDNGNEYHRVLLKHSQKRRGPFSRFFGDSEIELVQLKNNKAAKIYKDRFWGDQGFMHLCFDIRGMEKMRHVCNEEGHPFTIDSSSSFDMGDAAGHFSYIEDPDGTLIEFVETHKIPILKSLNWNIDLQKRPPEKPLPDWIMKAMALNKVKD